MGLVWLQGHNRWNEEKEGLWHARNFLRTAKGREKAQTGPCF